LSLHLCKKIHTMLLKIKGGTFNDIEGDYRVVDRSVHRTDINSGNIRGSKVTKSFNNKKIDSTGPPPQSPFMQQQLPEGGKIENRDMFNLENAHFKDLFNKPRTSAQPPNLVQNVVLSHMQHVEQEMRQAFSKSDGQPQSLSEENGVPNMPRNNDDDRSYDNNVPNNTPHVPTSSSVPTYRTIKGNLTKYDNSTHKVYISSHNVEGCTVEDSFN